MSQVMKNINKEEFSEVRHEVSCPIVDERLATACCTDASGTDEDISNFTEESLRLDEDDVETNEALSLPVELLVHIMLFLPLRDLLLGAALVCKRWNSAAGTPELWQSIGRDRRSRLTTDIVTNLLARCDVVRHINLKDRHNIHPSVMDKISRQANLQTLVLEGCTQFSPVLASISSIKTLKYLNLAEIDGLTDDALAKIAKSSTKLTRLDVSCCEEITDEGLGAVFEHCTDLENLNIGSCYQVTDNIFSKLPTEMRTLDISGCCQLTAEGLQYLAKLKKLTWLNASGIPAMKELLPALTKLKHLEFTCILIGDETDQLVATILKNNPNRAVFNITFG